MMEVDARSLPELLLISSIHIKCMNGELSPSWIVSLKPRHRRLELPRPKINIDKQRLVCLIQNRLHPLDVGQQVLLRPCYIVNLDTALRPFWTGEEWFPGSQRFLRTKRCGSTLGLHFLDAIFPF